MNTRIALALATLSILPIQARAEFAKASSTLSSMVLASNRMSVTGSGVFYNFNLPGIQDFTGTAVYYSLNSTASVPLYDLSDPTITDMLTPMSIDFKLSPTATTSLLKITFGTGHFSPGSGAVPGYFAGNNGDAFFPDDILFSGSLIKPQDPASDLSQNQFSFSLSPIPNAPGPGTVYSAVFSASGPVTQAVPEPATFAALGLGGLALLRRRRR